MEAVKHYKPKELQPGELKDAFGRAVIAVLGADVLIQIRYPGQFAGGIKSDEVILDADSIRTVVDLSKVTFILRAESKSTKVYRSVSISCSSREGVVELAAYGSDSVECLKRLALDIGLEEAEQPKGWIQQEFDSLESRIVAIEKATRTTSHLKCFISFKFDDIVTSSQVNRLKNFLSAVHIEWVTGEQYEPRRIEDKVISKLRADVDFVIAVVTKIGESKWITQEIADANGRGLRIIPLVEESATLHKGILGNLDHIPFKQCIDETFVEIAEGINFIKAERAAKADRHSEVE